MLVYIFSLRWGKSAGDDDLHPAAAAHRRHYDDVRALFIFAYKASALTVTLAIFLFVVLSTSHRGCNHRYGQRRKSMLWIALAFCGAIREYLVTLGFAVGFVFEPLSALAALYQLGPSYMVMGLSQGC
jgi:hypothetical protein